MWSHSADQGGIGHQQSGTNGSAFAKHGFHEVEYVRRWKNRVTDTLKTGRLYDAHVVHVVHVVHVIQIIRVIQVIEIKQVADVADRRVMSSSRVGRQSVQLTTKVRSRIPERKPAPTRGRGGLVYCMRHAYKLVRHTTAGDRGLCLLAAWRGIGRVAPPQTAKWA